MISNAVTQEALDTILALQLTVAWAGEGLCEPPRLGWWQTDLIDELGGGDLLARLLRDALKDVLPAAGGGTAAARRQLSDAVLSSRGLNAEG